jgi:PAS domain S-box-containing protein
MFSLRDTGGRVDSVCFIATDISERKRAERERDRAVASLRASEQRYRVFLENSQEGMLRIEFTPPVSTQLPEEEMIRLFYERGQMAECNDAHARLHGYKSAKELIGSRGTALRDPELHRAQDLAFIRNGYRLMGLPGVLKSVTGEMRQIVYNVTGIVEDGQLVRIWGTTQDVTEAKRLEEALRALTARQAVAIEEERSRISREIHDELGQQLTALKMDLRLLEKTPTPERLGELIQHIDDAVQTVRRIATELRPAILDHFGLAAAVEWQTAEFTKRSGLAHTCDVPEQMTVERGLAITVFRILQEALTNVARHAGAEHVEVILREQKDELVLRVVDDGRVLPERRNERPSLGILGMRERAAAFGG